MKEIWKEIPRLPNGKYQVSNFGRVKSKRWVMKFESNHYWHQRIKLYWAWWRNDVKHYQVHRLVYCVFNWLDYNVGLDEHISKSDGLILHKDNNPLNNRLDNLYMWTQKDNMSQCSREWRIVVPMLKWEYNAQSKLKNSDIKNIIKLIEDWIKQVDIAKMYGVSKSAICAINKRRCWGHLLPN